MTRLFPWRCGGVAVEQQVEITETPKKQQVPQQGKRTSLKKMKKKKRKKSKKEEQEEATTTTNHNDMVRVYSSQRRPSAVMLILLGSTLTGGCQWEEECVARLVELYQERHCSVVLVPNTSVCDVDVCARALCEEVGRLLQAADFSCVRVPLYIHACGSSHLVDRLETLLQPFAPASASRPPLPVSPALHASLNKSCRRLVVEPDDLADANDKDADPAKTADTSADSRGDALAPLTNQKGTTKTTTTTSSVFSRCIPRLKVPSWRTKTALPPPPPPAPPRDERAHNLYLRTTALRFFHAMETDRIVRDETPAPWWISDTFTSTILPQQQQRRRRRGRLPLSSTRATKKTNAVYMTGWEAEYAQFIDTCIFDDEDGGGGGDGSGGSTASLTLSDGEKRQVATTPRVVMEICPEAKEEEEEDEEEDTLDEQEVLVLLDRAAPSSTLMDRWIKMSAWRRQDEATAIVSKPDHGNDDEEGDLLVVM